LTGVPLGKSIAALIVAGSVVVAGGTAGSAERNGSRFRQRQAARPQGDAEAPGKGVPAQFVAESGGRIAVVSADTGRVVRYLTAPRPGGGAMEPTVSRDGRTVWFSRADGTCAAHVASVPATGGDEKAVPGSGEAGAEGTPLPRPGRPQVAFARAACHDKAADHALIVSDLGGDEGHGQLGLVPLAWNRGGDHLLATTADGGEARLLRMGPSGAILASESLAPADPTPNCRLAVVGFSPDENNGYVAVRRCGQSGSGSQARRSLVLLDKDLAQRQTVVRLARGQDFVDRLAFDATGHSLLYSTATPDGEVTLWLWRDGEVRRLGRPSRYRHPSWLP
jgi:hypothetical protein